MTSEGAPVRARVADVAVLLLLASLVVFYCWDASRASTHILNLILVLPLTVMVLVCCALQLVFTLTASDKTLPLREPVKDVVPIMGLFAAYVISLNWGFDVGTFLFIVLSLWFHGERRIIWSVGYALAFSSLATLFFSNMLPYPMPMLVLGFAP